MARRNNRRISVPTRRKTSVPRRRRPFKTPRLPRSALRNNSTVGVSLPFVRDFQVYPTAVTTTTPTTSWLDKLKAFGSIAMKIFALLVTSTENIEIVDELGVRKVKASTAYVTSAVQSFWIGVEDLVKSSPLAEYENKSAANVTYQVPCMDYRQGKLNHLTVTISPGSQLSERAGRIVACLISTAEDEIREYRQPTNNSWLLKDNYTFSDVVQMSGAVTAPFGTPITLTWRPSRSSLGMRFTDVGQRSVDGADFTNNLFGGTPLLRVIIGYQDYASVDGSFASLYAANEALVHVDMRGHVSLREPGRTYIRSWPQVSMNTSSIGCATEESSGLITMDIPNDSFFLHPKTGVLMLERALVVDNLDLEAMAI